MEAHHQSLSPPDRLASNWKHSSDYLFGIDLFNRGFYWEAHETWEQLWIKFGRSGRDADFLKGLIKLAAAGVKMREGRPIGVQRHACRAKKLFRVVWDTLADNGNAASFCGLNLASLCEAAEAIAETSDRGEANSVEQFTAVLPLILSPVEIASPASI